MKRVFALCVLCLPFLTGCASLHASDPADAVHTVKFNDEQRWWQVFKDPLMDELAGQLLTQSIDIKIAEARLREARSMVGVANADLFPSIGAAAGASRSNNTIGFPQTVQEENVGISAIWNLDLFGRTQAGIKSAKARLTAQEANIDDIENIAFADLFFAVVKWRQAQQTIHDTNALLASQDDQVNLLNTRAKIGLIDASFSERAQAQRAQTSTQLPQAEAAAKTAQYQIEKLLGVQDDKIEKILKDAKPREPAIPDPKTVVAISLDALRNRPDMRIARANMLAAQGDLDRAEAELWPRISLKGFFGVQSITDNVPVAGNPIWSLASAISLPILNFGRLHGLVDAANERSKIAALDYENTTLLALQEAKTALSDYLNGINAMNRQMEALAHRQDTVAIAKERFDHGLTDMTDLTTAQSELDQATIALIDKKAAVLFAYIRLQKAFGTVVQWRS